MSNLCGGQCVLLKLETPTSIPDPFHRSAKPIPGGGACLGASEMSSMERQGSTRCSRRGISLPFVAILLTSLVCGDVLSGTEKASSVVGVVVKVVDGDGLRVETSKGEVEIRLNGIDAPEMQQPGGKESKEFMSSLVLGKSITVLPVEVDRYKRLVGRVYRGKIDVGASAVSAGHAWAYRRYLTKDTSHYCRLEEQARERKKGIWGSEGPIYPHDWRRHRSDKKHSIAPRVTTEESCSAEIGE